MLPAVIVHHKLCMGHVSNTHSIISLVSDCSDSLCSITPLLFPSPSHCLLSSTTNFFFFLHCFRLDLRLSCNSLDFPQRDLIYGWHDDCLPWMSELNFQPCNNIKEERNTETVSMITNTSITLLIVFSRQPQSLWLFPSINNYLFTTIFDCMWSCTNCSKHGGVCS